MIHGNYTEDTGYQPACFAVAYRKTKQALREGFYLSKRQMFADLIDEDPFIWRDDGLIKDGISAAVEEWY